jgi:hypothetical protein
MNHPLPADLGPGWLYAGSVAVDSGTVLLIDPGYKRPDLEAVHRSAAPYGEVPLSAAPLHTAVACQSGLGDGIYPAYVRLAASGRVAELRVVFLDSAQTTEAETGAQRIIGAHAERLGVPVDLLAELLLSYAAGELQAWEQQQEAADPGSVGYTGDAPDWLEPHLKQLRPPAF